MLPRHIVIPEETLGTILRLGGDWKVKTVSTSAKSNVVTVRIAEGENFWTAQACPACQKQPVRCHDHLRPRAWQHLIGFDAGISLECAMPRGQCVHCKQVYRVKAAWEGVTTYFTRSFETYALSLLREMPIKQAAAILRQPERLLWRILFALADGQDAEQSGVATKILRNEWVAGGVVVGFEDRSL